ncbi:MAG: hypothetical protein ACP5O0_04780 [Acidimicrobiales bacterium]
MPGLDEAVFKLKEISGAEVRGEYLRISDRRVRRGWILSVTTFVERESGPLGP